MDITDYFPVGTKIVIEVVSRGSSGYCMDCIFFKTGDCGRIMCTARPRKDNKNILFKVVEVKEPCMNTGKNEQEEQE